MTKIVPADIAVNQDLAKSAIEESFSFAVRSIKRIGEGWDNQVYQVNNDLIFRFPRRKVSVPLLKREMLTLGLISKELDIEIPNPEYLSEGNSFFSFPFYGHRLIIGKTGCRVKLNHEEYLAAAKDYGIFLRDLHHIDTNKLLSSNDDLKPVFDRVDTKKMFQTFEKYYLDVKEKHNLEIYTEKIMRIIRTAENYKKCNSLTIVHGDLYSRHLLFSKSHKLAGIIDWGDCCINDPVVDYAALFQFFPQDYHNYFWEQYGNVSKETKNYGRFLGLYSAIALLWYGTDRIDKDLISSSLNTLEMI